MKQNIPKFQQDKLNGMEIMIKQNAEIIRLLKIIAMRLENEDKNDTLSFV